MKLLWLAIYFTVCVVAGLWVYGRSAAQVKFYDGLIGFCHYLHAQIGFALQPLPQVVGAVIDQYHGQFGQLLNDYQNLLQQHHALTREKCANLSRDPQVVEFFYQLGRTSSTEERDKIDHAVTTFVAKKTVAESDLRGKASIICKLLIIIGIAGVIIWI